MATIGLVTVLYKSDEVLSGFIKSVSKQTHKDYILYLVDNSVNEQSTKVIADCLSQYPVTSFKHIKNPGNEGVARGNNIGIQQAINDGCTHILILNNDIEIEQETAFASQLLLAENGESIIVPKIYYPDRTIWMAGGEMNKWRALGLHYGYNKPDDAQYNKPKYITYAPTCYMLVESKVFDKVGMMDEKYFAYYDDTDFVYRCINAGFKMYYDPTVMIIHKVSHSSGGDSSFYIYYSNRNKLYFIRKNFSGFLKYFAISYTFFTRVFFWIRFTKDQRKKLVQALKDGMYYPVERTKI